MLYVADTGSPKNHSNGPDAICTTDGTTDSATVGDGGLQKWILNPAVTAGVVNTGSTSTKETVSASSGAFTQGEVGLTITDSSGFIPAGTTITAVSAAGANATMSAAATGTNANDIVTVHGWSLAYTLYNGLNLVLNVDCDPSNDNTTGTGSTGLYGVTGVVNSGVATLYVTNYANDDLLQTYLYGITDTLATTTMSQSGHNVYAAGYRSNRFRLQGSVVCAVDSEWLRRDHQRSIWPHGFDLRRRMRAWHNYDSAVGSLDSKQRVHAERHFAANRGRGAVHVL